MRRPTALRLLIWLVLLTQQRTPDPLAGQGFFPDRGLDEGSRSPAPLGHGQRQEWFACACHLHERSYRQVTQSTLRRVREMRSALRIPTGAPLVANLCLQRTRYDQGHASGFIIGAGLTRNYGQRLQRLAARQGKVPESQVRSAGRYST